MKHSHPKERPTFWVTAAILSCACPMAFVASLYASRVDIRNGQFYVDNEPYYVRGVGYAPWRPHQRPGVSYADTNRRWSELDFERMKAAHVNTLRTWEPLSSEELALADKYGLMVLQGIRLDSTQDFSDPHNQDSAVEQVEAVARASKDAGNILGYIVMAEPSPKAVVESGEEATLQYFRRL
ncbi:MAG TPA: glycoside hydrolase family 2 TIM barrel-domain containing protein, partial [Elusimicrobiota bacterium]|nr:glycoside hydrolase family 2 TIM barrel-domain containing protein [Elusimicrobiota bacterium]